jgi:hypothetical protein
MKKLLLILTVFFVPLLCSADTFNPSNDNEVYIIPNATWSTIHNASSGTLRSDVYNIAWCDYRSADGGYELARVFENFNTASLPDTAVVTSATLELYPEGVAGTTVNFALYDSTASDTIIAGDYDQCGTTILSDQKLISDITVGVKFSFTLNSAGLAYVSKTGITKLCIREVEHDVANTAPTTDQLRRWWFTSNTGSASNRPLLTVLYTLPTKSNFWFWDY